MLGGMEKETKHRRGQLCPSYLPRVAEYAGVSRAHLRERPLHRLAKHRNQSLTIDTQLVGAFLCIEGITLAG